MRRAWLEHVPVMAPYVMIVTGLGFDSFRSDSLLWPWGEVAAFALLIPGIVVALPVIYVVGAWAWQVHESMPGQPMWPVTVTFTALFALASVGNALLLSALWTWRKRVSFKA